MSTAFPIIVQKQIDKSMSEPGSSFQVSEQLRFANLNASKALGEIIGHETSLSIDVHGIRETILDVINENLLVNAGLELDEKVKDFPDSWQFTKGTSSISGMLDSSRTQYGSRAFKIEGTNPTDTPIKAYLSQKVKHGFIAHGFYSLSFYMLDYGTVAFDYFAEITAYSDMGVALESVSFLTPPSGDMDPAYGFMRWYESFQLPENVDHVVVKIGVTIPANTNDFFEAWIDYPCFNPGLALHRPSELVEGILKTKHISTEGLDAKVIKTGDITITKQLSLVTEGGDVRLRYNPDTEGNVLEFLRPTGVEGQFDTVVTLGKYGIDPKDYGIKAGGTYLSDAGIFIGEGEIQLGDNFSVTNEGYLTALAGKIANFTIEENRLSSITGNIYLDSHFDHIVVKSDNDIEAVFGQYDDKKYGIKAGGTILNKDGIDITSGRIRLGGDLGSPLFSVNNEGYMVAKSGTIANFTIHDNILQSNDARIIFNSEASSITLSDSIDYATIVQPGGIFSKAPIARLSHFDPTDASSDYYVNINKVYFGDFICNNHVDYLYNRMTGEIVKLKTASPDMPNTVQVEYDIIDFRNDPSGISTSYTETITFETKVRAAAIITDDNILDATFVKNLIVGSAEIAYASINTAHIQEIHGSKIIAGTIDVTKLEIGRAGNLIPNSTFISKEFYLDWVDLMLGSPNAPYNLLGDNFEWTEEEYLFDGASIRQSNIDGGVAYMGLDIQIGTVLKPNTSYVFSAFQKLLVPTGESLIGYNLDIQGNCIDVEETSSPNSDNKLDNFTHGWKRKAVKFRTGDSGYVRLLSVLREPSSDAVVGWVDGFMLEEGVVESSFYKSGVTRVRGSNIETGSIGLNQLNFTPLHSKNVIASINASDEGLLIQADRLAISSELYDLRATFNLEAGKMSSRVEKKVSYKPSGATLFKFDNKQLVSTNGILAEIVV